MIDTRQLGLPASAVRPAVGVALLALILTLLPLGLPAAQADHALGTPTDVTTDRYAGENRFDTAGLIADDVSGGTAPDVLLARAGLYPDALAGNYLAGVRGDPILLMPNDFIFEDTMGWLEDLGTENITILGGTNAISAGNEQALEDEGYNVDRIAGVDRFETAQLVAGEAADEGTVGAWDGDATAIVASGENFPDALVSGALSFSESFPLLLTNTDFLTDFTEQALGDLNIERVIIPGGQAAVSENTEDEIQDLGISTTRVDGRTRVTTATEFANFVQTEFGWSYELINLARGDDFPDALTIGPLAGQAAAPLLLTYDPNTLGGSTITGTDGQPEDETRPWLSEHACEILGLHFGGGDEAITTDTADEAEAAAEDAQNCPEPDATVAGITAQNIGSDVNVVGEDHTVTATVTQDGGGAFAGAGVRFEVTGAHTDTDQGTTGSNGQTSFTYTGDTAGNDTITACTNEDGSLPSDCEDADHTDTVTKTWNDDRVAATVDASPEEATNTVGDSHTVTVDVRDEEDEELGGVTVRLLVESGPNEGDTDSATTDANGDATLSYQGDGGEGDDQLLVWADIDGDSESDEGEPSDELLKHWEIGSPETLELTPPDEINSVDTTHTVTAHVQDENGNDVEGAVVRFEVTGTSSAAGNTFEAPTDAGGMASYSYTSSTAGDDTITACTEDDGGDPTSCATATGPSDTATKEWVAPVATMLTLTPAEAINTVGSTHQVTATVRDQFGDPFEGVTVLFEVTGTHIDGGTDTTDGDGQATFDYEGIAGGDDTITACTDDDGAEPAPTCLEATGPSDTASKHWQEVTALDLQPEEATNTVGETHSVTATVTDQNGDPVEGAVVRFEVESTSTTDTTDAEGRAHFSYTSATARNDTIVACANADGSDPGNCVSKTGPEDRASKHWETGPAARLDLAPDVDDDPSNSVGAAHQVTATVTDEFGNGVGGVVVRFEVTGTNQDEATDTTDAQGRATFVYSSEDVGEDLITACASPDGSEPSDCTPEPVDETENNDLTDTAPKEWTPGAPASIVMNTSEMTNTVNAVEALAAEHTVMATVFDEFGNPVGANEDVLFHVEGATTYTMPLDGDPTDGTSEEVQTNSSGVAAFTYTATVEDGQRETITACINYTHTPEATDCDGVTVASDFDTTYKNWIVTTTP